MNRADWYKIVKDLSDGIFGGMTPNATTSAPTELITLTSLLKMKEEFDAKFPSLSYQYGCDMSKETLDSLKIVFPEKKWTGPLPICGIEIHIVNSIPFGKVEECSCAGRN